MGVYITENISLKCSWINWIVLDDCVRTMNWQRLIKARHRMSRISENCSTLTVQDPTSASTANALLGLCIEVVHEDLQNPTLAHNGHLPDICFDPSKVCHNSAHGRPPSFPFRLALKKMNSNRDGSTYSKVKNLILICQTGHESILRQIIGTTRILLISSLDLLFERRNMLWQ